VKYASFENIVGLTLESVEGLEEGSSEVNLYTTCGRRFRMDHSQDCCEYVRVCEVIGDPNDLIGAEILKAEEVSEADQTQEYGTGTWTFYKFATRKGYVDIRWLGESNGYYSESVDFVEVL
jgi:hypothetical protein